MILSLVTVMEILVNISTNFKTEKKICVKKEKQSELNLKNFIYI